MARNPDIYSFLRTNGFILKESETAQSFGDFYDTFLKGNIEIRFLSDRGHKSIEICNNKNNDWQDLKLVKVLVGKTKYTNAITPIEEYVYFLEHSFNQILTLFRNDSYIETNSQLKRLREIRARELFGPKNNTMIEDLKLLICLDWPTLYAGLKNEWISYLNANKLVFNDPYFLSADEDLLVALGMIDVEDSANNKKAFLAAIESHVPEVKDTDTYNIAIRQWHLALLQTILENEQNDERKTRQIANLWAELDYIEEWRGFIYYMPAENGWVSGTEELLNRTVEWAFKEYASLVKLLP